VYGKRISTGDLYTAVENWDGKASFSRDVSISKLILAKNTAVPNQVVVRGATNALLGSFVLQAGAAEGVKISKVRVTMGATAGTDATGWTNIVLKKDTTQLASAIGTPSAHGTGDLVAISPSLIIVASSQAIINVYGDSDTTAVATDVTLGDITAIGSTSGQSITSPADAPGQSVGVTEGGALTLAADDTGTPIKAIIHGGQADVSLFKFKAKANVVENLTLNKLYVGVVNGAGNVTDVKLNGGGPASIVNGQANFSNLGITVPRGSSYSVDLSATVNSAGVLTPGNTVYIAPLYAEYNRTIGTVTMSGGVYTSYSSSTDRIAVYNIDQFTDDDPVYIDANGNGD
ncbi:unnamed protein product, partial [marine sediment metagenome]